MGKDVWVANYFKEWRESVKLIERLHNYHQTINNQGTLNR